MNDRRAVFFGLALMPLSVAEAAPAADLLRALLERHTRTGSDRIVRVAYGAWKSAPADRGALDAVVAELARTPFSALDWPGQFAAWTNLYNALTLSVVLDQYPVGSIREIKSKGGGLDPKALFGPWREKRVVVAGRKLSLDDIEHGIMRPTFKDPRVHYALNCASVGCPDLRFWRAETLSADLDAAARAYIGHPRGVQVGPKGLTLSSLYDWYAVDFGAGEPGLRAHLASHASVEMARAIKEAPIAGYVYDWALNDSDPKGRR
jgi:hypothetical protein